MKNYFFFLFLLSVSTLVFGQTQTRNIGSFSELDVSGNITVELTKQAKSVAKVTMIKGNADNLKTELSGGTLKIYFDEKSGVWNSGDQAKIVLGFNTLQAIDASAGASVSTTEKIASNDFNLEASSGAAVSICVDAQKCKAEVSSGAAVTIEGTTNSFTASASSGGALKAEELTSSDVIASASSGAAIKVHARQKIVANASSGGAIKYKGNPSEKSLDAGKWSGGAISSY